MTDDQTIYLNDYIATLRRRRWQFILPAILVFVIAVGVTLGLPNTYQSTATILIEQQEIPIDFVRSTVTGYADQRIQVIRQRVMTSQNLGQIVERHDLYAELRRSTGMASAIDKLRDNIAIEMVSADIADPQSGRSGTATIAFSISYLAYSPTIAQRIANDIVSLFLDENLRERKRTAQEASQFLAQESSNLADQVSELEGKLAKFKEESGDAIPEMMQVNLQLMQRTDDSIRQVEQEISALEVTQIYLQSELGKLNPYTSLYNSTGERILSPADRLNALETEQLSVSARYAQTHPDRIAVERELEVLRREVVRRDADDFRRLLKEQKDKLTTLKSKYSNQHPSIISLERQINETERQIATGSKRPSKTSTLGVADADDPAYIQLQSQQAANQAKLDALRQTREELGSRLKDFEKRVTEAPKVEREYRLITRDYESAIEKYNQVRSKHLEATLAETLEAERKGERFTLIEPPLVPEKAHSPNRRALFLVGFVMSIGFGLAILAAREALSDGIYTIRSIKTLTGSAPLTIVPVIETRQDRKKLTIRRLAYVGIATSIIITTAYATHFFVRPLDVVWFQIIGRLHLAPIVSAIPRESHTVNPHWQRRDNFSKAFNSNVSCTTQSNDMAVRSADTA